MENLALRMRARHGHELRRSIEPYGFVPQRPEVIQITARSATKIKDRIRRGALYCFQKCRVVLADIVVSRAVPKSPGEPIIVRDRRVREVPDLLYAISTGGAAHCSVSTLVRQEASLALRLPSGSTVCNNSFDLFELLQRAQVDRMRLPWINLRPGSPGNLANVDVAAG